MTQFSAIAALFKKLSNEALSFADALETVEHDSCNIRENEMYDGFNCLR